MNKVNAQELTAAIIKAETRARRASAEHCQCHKDVEHAINDAEKAAVKKTEVEAYEELMAAKTEREVLKRQMKDLYKADIILG